jgi:hypothetical protein
MNIYKTLQWIREGKFKELPYNVQGALVGPKITNGQSTEQMCLILLVKEKLPLSQLPSNMIIPQNLEIETEIVLTDVQETILHQTIATTACHNNSENVEPVKSNRIRYRPLVGGISSININSSDATLGLIVRDKSDGQVVALSNNHVYAASQVSTAVSSTTANNLGKINTLELSGRQPGSPSSNSYGNTDSSIDYIGKCKRPVLIGNISPSLDPYGYIQGTSVDAAILQLSSYNLIDPLSSGRVVNFSEMPPYKFASDHEIDSLIDPTSLNYRSPIFRSGRTKGPIGFPGFSNFCKLSVYQLGYANVGLYSGYRSWFSDSFYVQGNVSPGGGGDSGSAMFALLSSNVPSASAWKTIGLLFAGPPDDSYSIGCRITSIVRDLDIVPWDLKMPTVSSENNILVYTSKAPVLTLSGRKYFQVGRSV